MAEIKKQEIYVGPKKTEIPVDWSLSNLGNLTSNTGQYGANESAVNYEPSKYRYIRVTDMTEDGRLTDKDKKSINKEGNEKYELEDNDLLFARTGSPGMSYIVDTDDYEGDAVFAGYLIRFDLLEEEIEPKFMRYYLQSYYFWSWINSFKRSTTLSNVNAGEYSTLPVILPELPEQRRIAEILSTVDEAIQQTDEIIETGKVLKKGLMQDLLTKGIGHEEFKEISLGPKRIEITEGWSHEYFNDVIDVNPSYDTPDEDSFEFLPMDAVNEEGKGIEYWNERDADDCTRIRFKEGDTVYAKITPCTENGKIGFVEDLDGEIAFGSTEFLVFSPTEKMDPKYVFYLTNLPPFRQVTISLMEGSTGRQRVPMDIFKENLRIPVPPLNEQREIAERLSTVDEKIRQEEEYREKIEELKKGLMQDLLTGEVRVQV